MAAFLLPGKRSVRAFGIGWGSQKAKAGFLRGEDLFRFSLYGLQRQDNVGNGVKELWATPHKSCAPSSRIFLRGNGVQNARNSAAIPVLLSLFHTKISRDSGDTPFVRYCLRYISLHHPLQPPYP
jgi:hypothetical protein